MSELASPEYRWGRVKEVCSSCPRGIDRAGEAVCLHPWRGIIDRALKSSGVVSWDDLAYCWDAGATIGLEGSGNAKSKRASIELFFDKPVESEGMQFFEIS